MVEQKHSFFLIIGGVVFAVLVIFYVSSLRLQLQEIKANQKNYEEQIKSLSSVKETEAIGSNRDFVNSYFTYESIKERYEKIQPLMTEKGYATVYPSAGELPGSSDKVSSSLTGLKAFKNQSTKTEMEFLNELTLTTEFNDIGNTEMVYVKTKLVYVNGQGWKVDGVEFVGQVRERGRI